LQLSRGRPFRPSLQALKRVKPWDRGVVCSCRSRRLSDRTLEAHAQPDPNSTPSRPAGHCSNTAVTALSRSVTHPNYAHTPTHVADSDSAVAVSDTSKLCSHADTCSHTHRLGLARRSDSLTRASWNILYSLSRSPLLLKSRKCTYAYSERSVPGGGGGGAYARVCVCVCVRVCVCACVCAGSADVGRVIGVGPI
jgi:hypothetical protein